MKHGKKLVSLLLALVMVMGLAVTASAAQEGTLTGGSITIDNAVEGQTYDVYQILYIESYNATTSAYSYKANSAWKEWLKNQSTYVAFDEQEYVTWVKDADAAAFAKLAQVEAAKMSADATATAESTTVKFEGLKLGYYLVDTTLGTLCSLDTTNPNVTMKEKNAVPTNEKTVEEDSTGDYGPTNDADIGQTVNFKSTITAQAGAENYVFHDKMSAGLTFGSVTGITLKGEPVAKSNYTVETTGLTDGCTFEIVFKKEFCDTLGKDDEIVISYTATLNENAVVGTNGNPNESKLSYGDSSNTKYTTPSQTITYTWDMDVLKYTKNGETKTPLAGAKFTLSKNENGTDPIKLIAEGNNVYRVAKDGETGSITEITTDATGAFKIKGLDSDKYYLTETQAPAGYNKLSGPVVVVIEADGTVKVDNTPVEKVEVLNQTGTELPSTGGIGTTIFYVIGGILVLGAAVLLVTRKRMDA